jgi:hypothetical protein
MRREALRRARLSYYRQNEELRPRAANHQLHRYSLTKGPALAPAILFVGSSEGPAAFEVGACQITPSTTVGVSNSGCALSLEAARSSARRVPGGRGPSAVRPSD